MPPTKYIHFEHKINNKHVLHFLDWILFLFYFKKTIEIGHCGKVTKHLLADKQDLKGLPTLDRGSEFLILFQLNEGSSFKT